MTTFDVLKDQAKLLLEAKLRPLQGQRFQPTGFADLGAATYTSPDGVDMLLVESAQSVANRMESVCWDFARDDVVEVLTGLPYVRVLSGDAGANGRFLTSSILEAHRLHSPYVMGDTAFLDRIKNEFLAFEDAPVDLRRIAQAVYKYDPNSLLHGVFFANKQLAGGRVRLQRIVSGFIEASDVRIVESGGVKNDRVNPSGDTGAGYGNVPYHRAEYVAADIRAYFNLDLAGLRAYGLGEQREAFLIALALWKIQRFLQVGLRLRTACDLEMVGGLTVTRPNGFPLPSTEELEAVIAAALDSETGFAEPRVTVVRWTKPKSKARTDADATDDSAPDGEAGA